jgi:CubicO group peptidase (beta-lactamase class C family)
MSAPQHTISRRAALASLAAATTCGSAMAKGTVGTVGTVNSGAESDATRLIDAEGLEVAHFGFNAVLRDYARLGRLLAHDGAWEGKQIIPAQWMIDATTVRPSDANLLPGKSMPTFGNGYLLWLLPGKRRQFALFGDKGHRICVDPVSRLVLVQTALETTTEVWPLWAAIVGQFGQG